MYTQSFNQVVKGINKATQGRVRRLFVPKRTFLVASGSGQPESEAYTEAIQKLYGLAYAIRFLPKRGTTPPGYEPYSVGALEAVYYLSAPDWEWTLMLPQPEFVTVETTELARGELKRRGKTELSSVDLVEWQEGDSIQTLYMGKYGPMQPAVDLLMGYAALYRLRPGQHHEIYLNDPRRVGEERAKTVVRYAVSLS